MNVQRSCPADLHVSAGLRQPVPSLHKARHGQLESLVGWQLCSDCCYSGNISGGASQDSAPECTLKQEQWERLYQLRGNMAVPGTAQSGSIFHLRIANTQNQVVALMFS